MNNVLIINTPYYVPDAVPYGPAIVSGILNNNGYNCSTWDLNIDLYHQFHQRDEWELFHKNLSIGWAGNFNQGISEFVDEILAWLEKSLDAKIKEYDPNLIGISVFSSHSCDFVIPIASLFRKKLPNAYIFLGGQGLTNLEKRTNEEYGKFFIDRLDINCAYMGDAENQLVDCINQRVEGIYKADPVDAGSLENVPAANWNGYDFSLYLGYDDKNLRLPITTSKGCIRECTFCDVASIWPKFIFRKGKLVAEELIKTYQLSGISKFEFTDNLINGSVSNFREMNTVLAEQLPNVLDYKSYAICRGKKESPRSDFELASIAGATLFKIGIESGSDAVRYAMKKKFTNDDIDWFSENCLEYNIQQSWLMFVGYPTETEKDFQETLALLERYRGEIKTGQIVIWLSLPMMMNTNGGILKHYAKEYGLEHILNDPWKEHFWTSSLYPDNTFEVRADRWKRFVEKLNDIRPNYAELPKKYIANRQQEKILELEGLEKIYADYKKTDHQKFIPIIETHFES